MKLVDLTLPTPVATPENPQTTTLEEREFQGYVAMVYHFHHDGMIGTYLDLPGHIKATDDGFDSANYPLEKLFRVEATVIHLDRADGSGVVTAAELEAACPRPFRGQALVLNALGARRFDEIEFRSVWIGQDARVWMKRQNIHLLVSDIFEAKKLDGVFPFLFGAGISTVCQPINLTALTTPYVRLTVLPIRYETVTQMPCRVVAELI